MSKPAVEGMARELMRHLEDLSARYLITHEGGTLARSETALLRFLADRGPSSMSDISSGLGLALSSTTGVVDGLVERKLVERHRSEDDRRRVVVGLTRAGRRVHEEFVRARSEMGAAMLEPLSESERAKLLELVRRMNPPSD